MKRSATFASMLLLTGCVSLKAPDTSHWESTEGQPLISKGQVTIVRTFSSTEYAHAAELGRWYAQKELHLTATQVQRMDVDFVGLAEQGDPRIIVGFYDPRRHKRNADGHYSPMNGGFPGYFTVTVDPRNWLVLSSAASRE